MSFQISSAIDRNKAFLVWQSELKGRLDPLMVLYQREMNQFKYKTKHLSSFLRLLPQYGANEVGIERHLPDEPRYIRITDIDEDGLLKQDKGETATTVESKYLLSNNDLLIARSGATVGKSYIHKTERVSYPCFFAGYMIRFIINEEKINPDYVFAYTQLPIYDRWVSAIQRVTAQPNINAEEYRSLEIPIPPSNIQAKIVDKMDVAYEAKKKKETEAQQLLDSIEGYLLSELGIKLPKQEENSLVNRMFIRHFREVSGGRFDAQSLLPYYTYIMESINSSKFPTKKLKSIAKKILRPFHPVEGKEYNYIQLGSIGRENSEVIETRKIHLPDIPSRAQQVVKSGEILFSVANPHWGVHILIKDEYDKYAASSGFAILDCIKQNNLFIVELLRTNLYRRLYEKHLTGAGLFLNIAERDLMNMTIPLPPIRKQNEIAGNIASIRSQVKALKQQAREEVEQAKKGVEVMILGDSQ